jgi:hypothetical protein
MKIRNNIALSESGFIFNPNTGESFTLNPTGQKLFGLIRDGKDYKAIRKYFIDNFDTEDSIFEKDFEDFMHMMNSYQMMDADEQA